MEDWEGRLEGNSGMEAWKGSLEGKIAGKVDRAGSRKGGIQEVVAGRWAGRRYSSMDPQIKYAGPIGPWPQEHIWAPMANESQVPGPKGQRASRANGPKGPMDPKGPLRIPREIPLGPQWTPPWDPHGWDPNGTP